MEHITLVEWVKNNLEDNLQDIQKHGCAGGFSGITCYYETTALYNQFQEEIWERVVDLAEDFGKTPLELIAEFGGADNVECEGTFKNLLVWFAVEEIANELVEEEEENAD